MGEKFFIVDTYGQPGAPGTFGNAPNNVYTDAAGNRFLVNYLDYDPADGDGLYNDISLTVLSAAVPEPSTWALTFFGAAGVGARRPAAAGKAEHRSRVRYPLTGSNISLLRRSTLAPRRRNNSAMSGVMNWPS